MPQEGLLTAGGLSTSDIEDTTVTLPAGLVINPGQAAGLQACPLGPASSEPGHERYGDNLPLPGENGEEERFEGPAYCPSASRVGMVTIKTPLIEGAEEKQFEGEVFVLQSNPPELKLLIAASADGVNLKLVGTVHLNEQTGQLVTTFDKRPSCRSRTSSWRSAAARRRRWRRRPRAAITRPSQISRRGAARFIPDVFPTSTLRDHERRRWRRRVHQGRCRSARS